MGELTVLLGAAERGEPGASEALFAALYGELHRLARRQLAKNPGSALGATSLLHEAFLDIQAREGVAFPDRARFFGYAAKVVRGLIVDCARRNSAVKRGGQFEIISLEGGTTPLDVPAAESDELVRLGEALQELERAAPELAQVVDLKYFCGLTFEEIAALRGVAERTVQRHWDKARIFLRHALVEGTG